MITAEIARSYSKKALADVARYERLLVEVDKHITEMSKNGLWKITWEIREISPNIVHKLRDKLHRAGFGLSPSTKADVLHISWENNSVPF